jgi:hypothetical protein
MKYLYLFLLTLSFQTAFAQFASPTMIDSTNAAFITNISIVDMDNDNQNDIVVTYFTDSVRWYKNNNLSFTKMPLISSGLNTPVHIDIADIDGNGWKDVLITNKSSNNTNNKIQLVKNQGNGTSWNAIQIDFNIVQSIVRSYFIDMDNDGDLDIISCHDLDIAIYYNNGTGTFSARNSVAGAGINEFYNLVVKDYNADGFKDFVTHTANGTEYYRANSTNSAYIKQLLTPQIHSLLETADIDNDGDFELFYPNESNPTFIETYKNNGVGSFSISQSTVFVAGSSANPPLKFTKVNTDNFIDAIYRNSTIKGIYYRENDGAGNFIAPKLVDSIFSYTYMNAGDLDNDNKPDILWAAGGASNKRYFGFTKNQMTVTAVANTLNTTQNVKLFPNPAVYKIMIKHAYSSNKHVTQVTNCLGITIFQSNNIPSEINVSNWQAGVYFLKIEHQLYKFVKI